MANSKISTIQEVVRDTTGRKVGMCHGVFDLPHPGHIAHLQEAARRCEWLVVSVTEDRYVRAAKGLGHPKFPAMQRAQMLAALECVNFVVIDAAPDPCENIRLLKPALYFKGAEYEPAGPKRELLEHLEGAVLAEYGGELAFTSADVVYSSTELLHQKRDFGSYHKDPEKYAQLAEEEYARTPEVVLPLEFAKAFPNDLNMFLIRLARYKCAARMLEPTDRVLEVGSGFGIGSIFLGQHCRSVLGIDVQEHAVMEAQALNSRTNVSFQHADFLQYESHELYNAVFLMDVIEHSDVPTGERMLKRAAALVMEGGLLIVGTPSVYSMPYQSAFSQASHVHCYDREELRELMWKVCARVLCFCMNGETLHMDHPKMAWYYLMVGVVL